MWKMIYKNKFSFDLLWSVSDNFVKTPADLWLCTPPDLSAELRYTKEDSEVANHKGFYKDDAKEHY